MIYRILFFFSFPASAVALYTGLWWLVDGALAESGDVRNVKLLGSAVIFLVTAGSFSFCWRKFLEQREWENRHRVRFLPDEPRGRIVWAVILAGLYFYAVTSFGMELMDSMGMFHSNVPQPLRLTFL